MRELVQRPKVLLDTRMLAGKLTGVGRYVTNLVQEMLALAPADLSFHMLCLPEDNVPEGIPRHVLKGIGSGVRPMGLLQQLVVPWAVLKSGCDLYHYPSYDPPWSLGRPLVATCYDIEPLCVPQLFPRKIVLYYKLLTTRLRWADKVIVISENTGKDIAELLGIDPGRMRVIHLGVDPRFHPIMDGQQTADLRNRYKLPDKFVLYVGNTMPHKNLPRLVQAMAIVHQRYPGIFLILAGGKDKYRPAVERAIQDVNLAETVRFLGRVPEIDLPGLYSCASLFVFPSLYEGFGLPVLEAMACGTPVVTSNAASIPEIIGDAGITVDPHDVEALACGILRLLENQGEAKYFSELGIQRARQFTWRRCAEEHLDVYREVLEGR